MVTKIREPSDEKQSDSIIVYRVPLPSEKMKDTTMAASVGHFRK